MNTEQNFYMIKVVGNMKLTAKQQTTIEIILVLGVMLLVKDIADRFNTIGAGSLAMWCGILVATYFMRKKGMTWQSRGLSLPVGKKDWLKSIGLVVVATITVIVFMAIAIPLISSLLDIAIPDSATDRFEFFLGKPFVFAAYLVIVIWLGAALGEELLMRGFLLNHLIEIFGSEKLGKTLAVLLHAIIFGMLHISQGVPGIIGTAGVAIIFAAIYLFNDRKLFPLILAHGLINSISIFAYYLTNGAIQ